MKGAKHMHMPFEISEYIERQNKLMQNIPPSSVVFIPTNDVSYRSNDVSYPFRPNSYFLYLCGWEESEGILVFTKDSDEYNSTLFVSPRDTSKEIWEGVRIGVEGALEWPVTKAESILDFESDLKQLLNKCQNIYSLSGISRKLDSLLVNQKISDPKPILDKLRRIKSSKEIEYMSVAAEIGSIAKISAMKKSKPGIGEWEIQAIIESTFLNSRSNWSFPSIVGGGDNATILHYKSNNSRINDGDLVLVDSGCEVFGYASDITRTWPINGKFTDSQKEIYDLVLSAQVAGIASCISGNNWSSMHRATTEIIAQGLIDLGIFDYNMDEVLGDPEKLDGRFQSFFMHGTGHFLGLDVHDVGGGRQGDKDNGPMLKPGMVVTVEPGLYFGSWRSDIVSPSRYSGMGVRIEDDVLITEEGPVVLSSKCPKTIDEIEDIVGSTD
ncbi:MAG: aminopeptidase P N-terminal domain-containing protein [Candidatus Thermoplasmatota archaeon]|nr:aminopeptidase P N-terminal domain-containing protein [Candidatus Thermoplasmatota archaeon]